RFSRDWSSDVCSSDLLGSIISSGNPPLLPSKGNAERDCSIFLDFTCPCIIKLAVFVEPLAPPEGNPAKFLKSLTFLGLTVVQEKIGRASCRERAYNTA